MYSLRRAVIKVYPLSVPERLGWHLLSRHIDTLSEHPRQSCLCHGVPKHELVVESLLERQVSEPLAGFGHSEDGREI